MIFLAKRHSVNCASLAVTSVTVVTRCQLRGAKIKRQVFQLSNVTSLHGYIVSFLYAYEYLVLLFVRC